MASTTPRRMSTASLPGLGGDAVSTSGTRPNCLTQKSGFEAERRPVTCEVVRVLIVEDERKLAQVLSSALQAEHYDVVVAADGRGRLLPRECRAVRPGRARSDAAGPQRTRDSPDAAAAAHRDAGADSHGARRRRRSRARTRSRRGRLPGQAVRAARAARADSRAAAPRAVRRTSFG